jgi:hypothetical protein
MIQYGRGLGGGIQAVSNQQSIQVCEDLYLNLYIDA